MSKLRFSDGMEFDTSGPLRKERRSDGLYIVGEGKLIPVKDDEEANLYLKTEERAKTILSSSNPQKEFFNQINNILKGK